MVHIFGQDFSYSQDYCLIFIVHEMVCAVSNCRIKAFDSIKDICWSRRRRRTKKIVDESSAGSLNYLSVKIRLFATRNQLQDSVAEKTDWANETRFYK